MIAAVLTLLSLILALPSIDPSSIPPFCSESRGPLSGSEGVSRGPVGAEHVSKLLKLLEVGSVESGSFAGRERSSQDAFQHIGVR